MREGRAIEAEKLRAELRGYKEKDISMLIYLENHPFHGGQKCVD